MAEMIKKLTPLSLIVVICLSVFLVLRILDAFNGSVGAHNLLGITGLAALVIGQLLGGAHSYKSDHAQNRTRADIVVGIGFIALIASYGIRYFGR